MDRLLVLQLHLGELRRTQPSKTQVKLRHEQPIHLEAAAAKGSIVVARGPWRVSGNWWSEDTYNRNRWDVALNSGVLIRLFREIDSRRWFVEGSYD